MKSAVARNQLKKDELSRGSDHNEEVNFHAFLIFIILVCSGLFPAQAQRIVNTEDEKIRLQGWDEYLREKARFERERMSDRRELGKDDRAWEKLKAEDLVKYRKLKIQRKKEHDDSGAEYQKDFALKQKEAENFQRQLDKFLDTRRQIRTRSKSSVKLTEEVELGLLEERERFEWEKRNLLDPKGTGGGKRSAAPSPRVFPGNSNPPTWDAGQVPPPPPPPQGFPAPEFELDVPPPPPPPPVPEFSEGFGDVPPPPPPGGFDEQVPPPLFEEDF